MRNRSIHPPGWRGNGKEGALGRIGLDHAVSIPAAYNLASITRHLRGGKTAFMELAESAAAAYACLGRPVELWNKLSCDDQRRLALEEVCRASNVAPEDLPAAVIAWSFGQNLDVARLVGAMIQPRLPYNWPDPG